MQPTYSKVSFHKVEEADTVITKRYDTSRFEYLFKVCPKEEKNEILIRIATVSGETLLKWGLIGGGVGTAIGIGTAVFTSRLELVVPCALYGGSAGFCIGGIAGGVVGGVFEYVKINQSTKFLIWKQGITKERYDLFKNCVNNYVKNPDFGEFLCSISYDIPQIPVLCPNGRIYDKATIERHLDERWSTIDNTIQQYTLSGYSPEMIEQKKKELLPTICPFRGQPYRKEDLRYACQFAENAIDMLRSITSMLIIDLEKDPIFLEGLKNLLNDYIKNHQSVTNEAIIQLSKEALKFGATQEQSEGLIQAFREHFSQK